MWAAVLAACATGVVLSRVGLTEEGYVSMSGDMARYLMDGVYLRDLLFDRPFDGVSQLLEYTRLYYARYPALSLGHHPVLLPVLEAPLFSLFGISVSVVRLLLLAALVAATVFLQLLVNRRYGSLAALATGLLFVTSPMIMWSTYVVTAEIVSIAFMVAGAYALWTFCETQRRSALVCAAIAVVLSVYARPMIVLVIPAFALVLVTTLPVKRLMRSDVLVALAVIAILTAPALIGPLVLSRSNAAGIMGAAVLHTRDPFNRLLIWALGPQLAWPVVAMAAAAAVRGLLRRDRFTIFLIVWVVGFAPALLFFGGIADEGKRYTLYWVPALCALAGSSLAGWRNRLVPSAFLIVLAWGLVLQASDRKVPRFDHASGYEEAAQFVLTAHPGSTVLFSGDIDTGYFSFFVRKHDPGRHLVVLRADKVFTTSRMARPSVEDRIERPDQIYEILHRFGTRYVVVEDIPSQSRVLEWLRQELHSPRFAERQRIALRTTDPRLRGTNLVIYELLDATDPEPDARLSLHLPVIGQSIDVPLQDLIDRKLLRYDE